MRFSRVVSLLPLATAFVITEPEVFSKIEKSGRRLVDNTQTVLDDALSKVKDEAQHAYSKFHDIGYDLEAWLEDEDFDDSVIDLDHPRGPHHGKPHHPPHHDKPHHPPHHEKPNRTVYELINESKYTTKLAELINQFDDVVELLNGTAANYTIFAPTDAAFEKIPKHHPQPSKEFLKEVLLYHVTDSFYPAGRVLHSFTIPTLYTTSKNLGHAQRLTPRVTFKGPTINYYSRLVAVNIFGTNGVVHGVDHILVPPPNVATILDLLPGAFSTLELALTKTGIYDWLNTTEYKHNGGTFFAPNNYAFKKLGPRANAFLFSKYGEKYLKALLEYHLVNDQTLYTDAFFDGSDDGDDDDDESTKDRPDYYHYDLPTVLDDKYLAVDVTRYGPFAEIRINGFSRVTIHDGIASDGVIQVVSDVLIPPKTAGGEEVFWKGDEIDVEDLKERLEPFIDNIEL
ncbi:hypothetical protein BM1_02966 [Bipolaris maydis]|nr:hypothetical protein BM1_02966 [Bipolaris maydis]